MQARIIKAHEPAQPLQPIKKAEGPTQVSEQEAFNAGDWIEPPAPLAGLHELAAESTILPQCIRAYKDNIAGFGIGVKYIEDIEETPEAEDEYKRMVEIIELLNTDQDTKEVFEDLIEARETYGIAYLEVIRNLDGEVQQIEFLHDTPSVRKTVPLEPYIDTTYYNHGVPIERKKKFRKYRQQLGGKTVYFKEFGDPRVMDRRNGVYVESPEDIKELPVDYEADEILEFPIGIQPYGEVRWTGQILGIDGLLAELGGGARLRIHRRGPADATLVPGHSPAWVWSRRVHRGRVHCSNILSVRLCTAKRNSGSPPSRCSLSARSSSSACSPCSARFRLPATSMLRCSSNLV